MAEIEVQCPSGLQGRIRGLTGKDFRMLSAAKTAATTANSIGQMLRSCWLQTTDPGPYNDPDIHWDDALMGDRFYTMIAVRRATYPNELYDFDTTCPSRECKRTIKASLDLADLETKPLPPASAEKFAAGDNKFETTISDGRKLWFKLMTGSDIKRQTKIQEVMGPAAQGLLLTLASRIIEVEGLKSKGPRDIFGFLDELQFSEHRDLIEKFDAADCGVQTDIGVGCEWCGAESKVSLPLGRGFLLPRKEAGTSLSIGEV